MHHKLLTVLALPAFFVFSLSCEKELSEACNGDDVVRFEASCPEVKTALNGGVHLSWVKGDTISICEQIAADNQKGAAFTATSSGASVSFEGKIKDLTKYYALYPYSALKNWKNDGSAAAYVTIPSKQEALTDNIDPKALIMCAKNTSGSKSFAFKPLVSLISFTIGPKSPEIVSVVLTAPGQYLAGSASLNASYSNPYTSGYGSKTSTITLSRKDCAVFPQGEYYIAVISRTYSGMTMEFTDKKGNKESKDLPACTLSAGTVYAMGIVKGILDKPTVETYKYSEELTSSSVYRVWVEGIEQFVYPMSSDSTIDPAQADRAHICTFGTDKPVRVSVEAVGVSPVSVSVAPVGKGYSYTLSGNKVEVTLSPYDRVSVEINELYKLNPLFVFVNPPETDKPEASSTVKVFSAGYYNKSHTGLNFTNSGKKTLYLEGGAVYRGNLVANEDSDITIAGFGIMDTMNAWVYALNFKKCKNININGVTVLASQAACNEFVECDSINCDNYKVIATYNKRQTYGLENDCFDFFGSKNARVTRCFAYAHDDLYAVDSKSFKKGWSGKVSNMVFDDCIGWNVRAGHMFTIGYATGEDISDVSFTNSYSIHSNIRTEGGSRNIGALGIHNGSVGTISNIKFENIYIEDPSRRPVGVEIMKSPYDEFPEGVYHPGIVQNVIFKNIYVLKANPLKEKSVIKGYDSDHKVADVSFDNFQYLGSRATSLSEADFEATNCSGVTFK